MLRPFRVLSFLLCCVCCFDIVFAQDTNHQTSQDMIGGQKNSLIELIISEYDPIQSCSIEYMHNSPNTAWARQELLVLNSGDYFVRGYQNHKDGPEELDYFVWSEGDLSRASHGPHGYEQYNEKDFVYVHSKLFDIPHYDEAPWPMIANWCRAFLKDDTTTLTHHGDKFTIANEHNGLSLTFDSQYHLLRLVTHKPGITAVYDYGGYKHDTAEQWDHPTTFHSLTTFTGKNAHDPLRDSRTITRVQFNIPDVDAQMAFDPDELTVHLYDPKTHNVYASDGSVLYNEDNVIASMDKMSGLRKYVRRGIWPLLAVLIVPSGIVAYKRIKTSG